MRTQNGNKRIVSKSEYVGIMGIRLLGFTAAVFFFGSGILGAILSGFGTCALFLALIGSSSQLGFLPIALVIVVVVFLLCIGLTVMGWVGMKTMGEEANVVPLTRQTASDVPARETLVRASSVDTLAAETVLLRPAQEQTNTAGEELLRPHSHT